MQLLHHRHLLLPEHRPPALERLSAYFKIYPGASPIDRTGTITFPTRMKSVFPLPQMRERQESYDNICAQRAADLLQLAARVDAQIYVFWSGGVDSTCALVSLLKQCKDKQRIIVLLTEKSVLEYPLFFTRYIRGKLRHAPADLFVDLFAGHNVIVSGEHNDQLFGSDIIGEAISLFGIEAVTGRLQRELLTSLFEYRLNGDRETALFFSGLFGRFIETAPVALKTNFDLLWWINFALKWQTVYMRTLLFSRQALSYDHVKTFYQPFFNTPEFQLWSMNNLDKRIKDHWRTYKWPAKDVIFEFTKDADYRDNKIKHQSLVSLLSKRPHHKFLDENFAFHQQVDWYQPVNDFQTRSIRSLESMALCG
jgi:hypothetical protein